MLNRTEVVMSLKSWQVVLVVPMALWLTACPNKNADSTVSQTSKFAGLWVRADALQDYTDSLSQQRPEIFCEDVQNFSARHGVGQDGNIQILARLIQTSGDVFAYTPSPGRADLRSYTHDMRIGSVANSGDFNYVGNEAPASPRGVARYGLYQNTHIADGSFSRDDFAHLTMIDNSTSSSHEYVRTDNATLLKYQNAIIQCLTQSGQTEATPPPRQPVRPTKTRPPTPDDEDDSLGNPEK